MWQYALPGCRRDIDARVFYIHPASGALRLRRRKYVIRSGRGEGLRGVGDSERAVKEWGGSPKLPCEKLTVGIYRLQIHQWKNKEGADREIKWEI